MTDSPSPDQRPFGSRQWAGFTLAGATARDRLLACAGAFTGIGLTAFVCNHMFPHDPHLPFLVAPMGASAVLLFAVPASPLAQPWSIIGGNTISALIGIAVLHWVPEPVIAAALAVAIAIGVMSLTRCLHPPGGAAALTAVLGGHSVLVAGVSFAFVPVALNSVLLVVCGWIFHRFSAHTYPHRPIPLRSPNLDTEDVAPPLRSGFQTTDIDAALQDFGESLDIGKNDIDRLLRLVEAHALIRANVAVTCEEIMSRQVVSVRDTAAPEAAKELLRHHGIRELPVIDRDERLRGVVGWPELEKPGDTLSTLLSTAPTSLPQTPALELLGPLTSGQTYAVMIVDDENHVRGVITQTDLLVAMSQLPALRVPASN